MVIIKGNFVLRYIVRRTEEDLNTGWRLTLTSILKKETVRIMTGFMWFKTKTQRLSAECLWWVK